MSVGRRRSMVSPDSVPRLAPYVRLRFDPVRDAWVALAPERVLWPDAVGLHILRHCDGKTPVSTIVARLTAEYDAEAQEIAADVGAFLQQWADRLMVRL
ncbi:pyrroloquinoline quinone biosynthesis peptide chaperone PqqD [Mesorhizobium sp. B2-1-3A]|uniref:pyrroloquinoline quinone biosynthesis peptide chaperone PqqD n=1 Tax=Mesorhizobium sp. B2-1-3A TaxID=2589971 RepID=UPI00112D9FD0|nr:pyrroloquinoline quinone biosynthesis peptide chaperone PqqD [Mesorhizobium sp. B2-1-3A]TPM90141.1 pyrroloquinoline quinone biosynthesis peptide chaperone PqqD [Mesorhizobium sp. B2-1-3A]